MNSVQYAEPVEKIRAFLKSHLSNKQAIVGISGGVDSALVLKLLSISINHERIKAFFLPDGKPQMNDEADVVNLSRFTGVSIETVNMHEIVSAFVRILGIQDTKALGNVKSRIRMIILYYYANISNGMVIGTTNKSEYYTGYYTKFGDGGCDIEPILHLTKTDVWDMSRILGVPESIIHKPPSAGLWEGQRDEEELGLKYVDIDMALRKLIDGNTEPSNDAEKRVSELIGASEHKRRPPVSML